MAHKIIDISGQVYGLITVVSHAGRDSNGKTAWNVVCQCGTHRVMPSSVFKAKPPKTHLACTRARREEREKAARERR